MALSSTTLFIVLFEPFAFRRKNLPLLRKDERISCSKALLNENQLLAILSGA